MPRTTDTIACVGPYLKTLLLLAGGQIVGQGLAALVSQRLDPSPPPPGATTSSMLPIGGGASRADDVAMLAGSAGSLYLATRLKSPEARVFAVGMAMGAIAPVTQALAKAVAQKVTP